MPQQLSNAGFAKRSSGVFLVSVRKSCYSLNCFYIKNFTFLGLFKFHKAELTRFKLTYDAVLDKLWLNS